MSFMDILRGLAAGSPEEPAPPREEPPPRPARPPVPTGVPGVGLRLATACHPLDRGSAAGRDHWTVTAPLRDGQLRREAGDALCRPARRFWQLLDVHDDVPDSRFADRRGRCARCADLAARLGAAAP